MQIYCLDTNIFRGISDADAMIFSRQAQQNAIQFRCTPIVIVELLSRLKENYAQIKASLQRVVYLCGESNYLLPVPEHQLAIALGLEEYIPPSFKDASEALLRGVDLVLKSSSPEIVIDNIYSSEGNWIGQELFESDSYKQSRNAWEEKFIDGIKELVEKYGSQYKGRSDALDKAMAHPEALKNLALGLGHRCCDLERPSLLKLLPDLILRLNKLEAYMGYYRYIIRQWIDNGQMRKNPYNDLHQLVYLSIANSSLITEDKRFTKHIPQAQQRDRILTRKQALRYLQQ